MHCPGEAHPDRSRPKGAIVARDAGATESSGNGAIIHKGVGAERALGGHQRAVGAVRTPHQVRWGALLHQPAPLEHDDAIRIHHARQAMRNDRRGASALESLQRLLKQNAHLGRGGIGASFSSARAIARR